MSEQVKRNDENWIKYDSFFSGYPVKLRKTHQKF